MNGECLKGILREEKLAKIPIDWQVAQNALTIERKFVYHNHGNKV